MKEDKGRLAEEYTLRTLNHNREVVRLAVLLNRNIKKLSFKYDKWELLRNAVNHDLDKFRPDYINAVINLFYLKSTISERKIKKYEKIYNRHKQTQRHHVQYHIINNIAIKNFDICEMCCDWISSAKKDNPDLVENAKIWKKNFEKKIEKYPILEKYRNKFYSVFDVLDEALYGKYHDKIDLIRQANPDLEILKTEFIESGCHSLAIVINDKYIFRFPLKKEFFEKYINEEKLLKILNGKISTQIPFLTVYNIDGEVFTKHRIIDGEQYTNIGNELTEEEKLNLAKEIAVFISELHSVKSNEIEIQQFTADDYFIDHKYIKTLCDYLNDKTEIEKLNGVLEEFKIESQKLKDEDIVICHNDLNENNILVNRKTKKLAGIIDFGNSIKRDFSSEFSSLLKYDFLFMLQIIKEYEKITGKKVNLNYAILLQKIRCYGGMADGLADNDNQRLKRAEEWLQTLNNLIENNQEKNSK